MENFNFQPIYCQEKILPFSLEKTTFCNKKKLIKTMSDSNSMLILLNQLVNDPKYKPLLAIIKGIRNGIV